MSKHIVHLMLGCLVSAVQLINRVCFEIQCVGAVALDVSIVGGTSMYKSRFIPGINNIH